MVLRSIAAFITSGIIALESSWGLGLVLIPSLLFLMLGDILQIYLTNSLASKTWKLLEMSVKTAIESIDNIRTVTALGIAHILRNKYEKQLSKYLEYVLSLCNYIYLSVLYYHHCLGIHHLLSKSVLDCYCVLPHFISTISNHGITSYN